MVLHLVPGFSFSHTHFQRSDPFVELRDNLTMMVQDFSCKTSMNNQNNHLLSTITMNNLLRLSS